MENKSIIFLSSLLMSHMHIVFCNSLKSELHTKVLKWPNITPLDVDAVGCLEALGVYSVNQKYILRAKFIINKLVFLINIANFIAN